MSHDLFIYVVAGVACLVYLFSMAYQKKKGDTPRNEKRFDWLEEAHSRSPSCF